MKKIINPCSCEVQYPHSTQWVKAYCKIEFSNSRLSISGVVGPKRNGDCSGSAGQCVDSIREGRPTDDWTPEMLQKFCDIWDRWHLNDMRPWCKHQRELGWDELASKKITMYNYTLNRAAMDAKSQAEKAALTALQNGQVFTPTPEQVMYANLSYSLTKHREINEEEAKYYEPKKKLYSIDKGATETKTLGWLSPEEHPDGILTKACPVCGYKYGTAWQTEEVPQEVVDWLFALPDTMQQPAWV